MINKKTKQTRWVKTVQESSSAIDLPEGLFKLSAEEIAKALKKAVMKSTKTKGSKFQSAMSMLNYYINRAGKNLSDKDKARLEKAKTELRKAFGRDNRGL